MIQFRARVFNFFKPIVAEEYIERGRSHDFLGQYIEYYQHVWY